MSAVTGFKASGWPFSATAPVKQPMHWGQALPLMYFMPAQWHPGWVHDIPQFTSQRSKPGFLSKGKQQEQAFTQPLQQCSCQAGNESRPALPPVPPHQNHFLSGKCPCLASVETSLCHILSQLLVQSTGTQQSAAKSFAVAMLIVNGSGSNI